MEDADERKIPIPLGEIQSVTDHEQIRNGEPDVISADFLQTPRRFLEKHTGFYPTRLQLPDLSQHSLQCLARVQDIIYEQHVAAAHVDPQFLSEHQFPRFS